MERKRLLLAIGLIAIASFALWSTVTFTATNEWSSQTLTTSALNKPITVRGDLNGLGPFNYTYCGPDCQPANSANSAVSNTCTSGGPLERYTCSHTNSNVCVALCATSVSGSTQSYCGPLCQFTRSHTTTTTSTSTIRHRGAPSIVALVLAQFPDIPANTTAQQIGARWNNQIVDYYQHVSHGQFAPYADVFGWVTLPNNESYYGADCNGFLDSGAACAGYDYSWTVGRDAVSFLEYYQHANFTQYQYLVVVHSGFGQESSGVSNDVWSVTYTVAPTAGSTGNGHQGFTMYSIVPEHEAHGASTIGVMAAEFGHQQGWPDMFYSTEYTVAKTGRWELESVGTWNGNPFGSDPAYTLTINQYIAHWLYTGHGFTEINANAYLGVGDGSITINLTEVERDSGNMSFLIVSNGHPYWLEARRQVSWDSGIPMNGVLIGTMQHPSGTGSCPYLDSGCFYLLNATPGDLTLNHAAFQVGMIYGDPFTRIQIVSYSNGIYTINVSAVVGVH